MPTNDQDMDVWMTRFTTALTAHMALFGIPAGTQAAVDAAKDDFAATLATYIDKKDEAQSASAAKNTSKEEAKELVRPIVRQINNHPAMTDALREEFGLNIPGTGQATQGIGPEEPGLYLETRLGQVIVHFGTEPRNERINTKPSWAKGVNIYRKTAAEDVYTMVAMETSSPYVDSIYGNAADYTYMVRYRGTRPSEMGAESAEVIIAARGALAA